MEVVSFFLGIVTCYLSPLYALGLLSFQLFFRPNVKLIFMFGLGLCYALLHSMAHAPRYMPALHVIPHAKIIGTVINIPVDSIKRTQFEFQVESINQQKAVAKVLLSCHKACEQFKTGQRFILTAKLKKPQNLGNPGGYNYVRALLARHIEWTGYIYPNTTEYIGQSRHIRFYLMQARIFLAEQLDKTTLSIQHLHILKALTLGLGAEISSDNWSLFRRTGTTHLMVISGAHIGFVAGLIFGIVRFVWPRVSRAAVYIPAQRVAGIAALIAASIYSLFSGFGIPAQRALIMCFFGLLRYFTSYEMSTWQAWRYALFCVLVLEPHSVMMPGFYLSFIAVAILIFTNQVFSSKGIIKTIILQFACLIGLMPVTLLLFSYGAVSGFFANMLAIPWVGFLIIPLGLFITFAGSVVSIPSVLTHLLDKLMYYFMCYLTWSDKLSAINFESSSITVWGSILIWLSLCIVCIFRKVLYLPVVIVFVTLALRPLVLKIPHGEAYIDVLDVGQGLSVVVRTAKHLLIYDTGAKLSEDSDLAKRAIIPYLKTFNTRSIDMVVISHPDLDHRGGLASLSNAYMIRNFLSDDKSFYHMGENCHEYPSWQWDGVEFQFLPLPKLGKKRNNHSCILKISTQKHSMLLTGDIERVAERYLIHTYQNALKSSFLLVPHHGSQGSSSIEFLNKVSPVAAVVSYGFDNHYHHPHPKAMMRYKTENITVYSTEMCGLTRFILTQKDKLKRPLCSKYNKI